MACRYSMASCLAALDFKISISSTKSSNETFCTMVLLKDRKLGLGEESKIAAHGTWIPTDPPWAADGKKYGTAGAGLTREYGMPWKRRANPPSSCPPQAGRSSRAGLQADAQRRAAPLPVVNAIAVADAGPPSQSQGIYINRSDAWIRVSQPLVSAGRCPVRTCGTALAVDAGNSWRPASA